MSEKDREVRTDPWTGVTYRLEAGEKAPPRPHLTDACLRFLNLHASFEDQRKPGSLARDHIDDCPQCQQFIARKEWERKKEEELLSSPDVEALVAEYAQRFRVPVWQRRKVQLAAGLIVLILCSLWLVYSFLGDRSADGGVSRPQQVTLAVSVTPHADRALHSRSASLDRTFQEGGATAISKIFTGGSEQAILSTARWIAMKRHTALIPVLITALADPRLTVRVNVINALRAMPPLSVQPHLAALNAAAAAESDVGLTAALQGFASAVAQAR